MSSTFLETGLGVVMRFLPVASIIFWIARRKRWFEHSRDARNISFDKGFCASVQVVRNSVLESNKCTLSRVSEGFTLVPCTYTVIFKEHGIIRKKSGNVLYEGGEAKETTLLLTFAKNDSGQAIRGTHVGGDQFYTIEEGQVSRTGDAYWIERGSNKQASRLCKIYFSSDGSFHGEWLSSNAKRGECMFLKLREGEPMMRDIETTIHDGGGGHGLASGGISSQGVPPGVATGLREGRKMRDDIETGSINGGGGGHGVANGGVPSQGVPTGDATGVMTLAEAFRQAREQFIMGMLSGRGGDVIGIPTQM